MAKRTLTLIERRRWLFIDMLIRQLETRTFMNLDGAIELTDRTSGLFKEESLAIADTLRDKHIESMVEIGRCLGGSIYRYLCCFPIKKFLSIDIHEYITDDPIRQFMNYHNIQNEILVMDSSKYNPKNQMWDFVFIDGDHTKLGVRTDIEKWKDHCKYIGFHDFANKRYNTHYRRYSEVIQEVRAAFKKYNWTPIGIRGKSEIIFKVR